MIEDGPRKIAFAGTPEEVRKIKIFLNKYSAQEVIDMVNRYRERHGIKKNEN